MRVLVQRVRKASVSVDDRRIAEIGPGLVLLVGVGHQDTPEDAEFVARKCAHLRIFEDGQGRMNRSVLDVGGHALAVSQFTLYGNTQKGRRPSFTDAAPPEKVLELCRAFVEHLRLLGVPVEEGRFGEHMLVELHNDGPVTLMVETPTSGSA